MRHAVIPVLPDGTLPEGRKVEIVPALVQDMAGLHVRDADLKRRLSESLLWLVRAGASPDGALLQGGIDGDVVTVRGLGMDRAITGEPLFTIEALEPIFLHRTRMPEAVP